MQTHAPYVLDHMHVQRQNKRSASGTFQTRLSALQRLHKQPAQHMLLLLLLLCCRENAEARIWGRLGELQAEKRRRRASKQ
jgi:hypothetical protein